MTKVFADPLLADIVSVVFDGVVVHDGTCVLQANERAAQMFGYESASAMAGLPYPALVAPSSANLTRMRVESHTEGQYSMLCRRADGDEFPVDVNVKEATRDGARVRVVAFRYSVDHHTATEVVTQRSLALERTVNSLVSTIEQRDSFTAGHQNRVADLGTQIARALGMSDREVTTIRAAGNIHDIGKIAVPAEILMKPEALTPEEYSLIKLHPEIGFRIVHGIDFDGPVHEAILQHHERLDGSGYPSGTKDPIPEARILAVADVYDALTSPRPYRAGKRPAKALDLMQSQEVGRLDCEVVKALSSIVSEGMAGQ